MRKALRILIAILILSTGIHSTRYITWNESGSGLTQKLKPFLGENEITTLVNSPDGLIFGGTGSGFTAGSAILFYFDPTLIKDYSYGYAPDDYPRAIIQLSTTTIYRNIMAIQVLQTNSIPDTILFVAETGDGSDKYALYSIDYEAIISDTPYDYLHKVIESPNGCVYVTAFGLGPQRSGKNPLLYIAADNGVTDSHVEVFDPETMSFVDTMSFGVYSETSAKDYLGYSFTSDDTYAYMGTLTYNNIARILRLHPDGSWDELFQPTLEYFRNDDTTPTLQTAISAMEYYNGRIYCGTSSLSTKYGGNLFYYDTALSTGSIIGLSGPETRTFSVSDLDEWDGEIYGATIAEEKPDTTTNYIGCSRIFKISSSGIIDSREVLDYRIPATSYYNPSRISAICKSPLSRDIVFGTEYIGGQDYGGLIGLTDFYPPSAPAIKRIEKHEGRYRIYISPTGDDYLFGEATEYRISGGDSALADNPFGMKTPIETTDYGDYLEVFSIDHPYLYIRAFDNVYNYSSFADVQFTLSNIKVFPNPAIQKDGVNIYLPASTDKVNIYDISGNEIPASAFVISQATNSEGMLNYFWDLKSSDGDKVSSGIYLISVFDIDENTYHLKLAVIN